MKFSEDYHLTICCSNCIRRDQNATYKRDHIDRFEMIVGFDELSLEALTEGGGVEFMSAYPVKTIASKKISRA